MWAKQSSSRFVSAIIVVLLSSGTLALALNPSGAFRTAIGSQDSEPEGACVQQAEEPDATQPLVENVASEQLEVGLDGHKKDRVILDEFGILRGRIVLIGETGNLVSARGMKVQLLTPDGHVLRTATTGQRGQFSFSGMQPGVIGLIASGAQGKVATVMNVFPAATADVPVAPEFELQLAAVPPRDIRVAMEIVGSQVPRGVHSVSADKSNLITDADDAQYFEDVSASTVTYQPIRLQIDGSMIGRIHALHPVSGLPINPSETYVSLVRNGQQVAQVPVDADGTFRIDNVEPGIYSFVAAGTKGFTVFAMQVLPARPAAADFRKLGSYMPAMVVDAESTEFDPGLIWPTPVCGVPVCGVPVCGGGGGGGFGGGFGGGVIPNNNNCNDKTPLPATPIIPCYDR